MSIYDSLGNIIVSLQGVLSAEYGGRLLIKNVNLSAKNIKCGVIKDIAFECADFEAALAQEIVLKNLIFEGGCLNEANFQDSKIEGVEFYGVYAYEINFEKACITNSKFLGVNLSEAKFSSSKLIKVEFQADNIGHKCDLSGADLSHVDLSSVRFEGAIYNSETKFPCGFDPLKSKGLYFEEL